MKKEAYVLNIAGEDNVLVAQEEEARDLVGWTPDESSDAVEVRADDPRLTQETVEIDPGADAFAPVIAISIH